MCYLTIYCFSRWQNYYILCFMKLAINTTFKMTLNYKKAFLKRMLTSYSPALQSIKRGKMLDFDDFWRQHQGSTKREYSFGVRQILLKTEHTNYLSPICCKEKSVNLGNREISFYHVYLWGLKLATSISISEMWLSFHFINMILIF